MQLLLDPARDHPEEIESKHIKTCDGKKDENFSCGAQERCLLLLCCDLLGHPFSSGTTAVMAMSGVAATLPHGETTHGALALMCKIQNKEIEEWEDTGLAIVDKISLSTKSPLLHTWNSRPCARAY